MTTYKIDADLQQTPISFDFVSFPSNDSRHTLESMWAGSFLFNHFLKRNFFLFFFFVTIILSFFFFPLHKIYFLISFCRLSRSLLAINLFVWAVTPFTKRHDQLNQHFSHIKHERKDKTQAIKVGFYFKCPYCLRQ